jgi:NADH-ubiquinone oxidoreductase chain 1
VSTPLSLNPISLGSRWIFLLIILRFGIYPMLLAGWSSNRKYSFLGAIRRVAQVISYEIVLTVILFSILILRAGSLTRSVININKYILLIIIFPPFYIVWILRCIAESNRTPFDFAEGERELVSGFNTEFSSGGFAIIFISEYLRILFLRIIRASLIRKDSNSIFFLLVWINTFLWIWIRRTFPRHRYDLIIILTWKSLLPLLRIFYLRTVLLELIIYF